MRVSSAASPAPDSRSTRPMHPVKRVSATCRKPGKNCSPHSGVPIQRVGEKLGVLVVQSKTARQFNEDEIYALDVVAMVVAEMTELGAFTSGDGAMRALHKQPVMFRATSGQEGAAEPPGLAA